MGNYANLIRKSIKSNSIKYLVVLINPHGPLTSKYLNVRRFPERVPHDMIHCMHTQTNNMVATKSVRFNNKPSLRC